MSNSSLKSIAKKLSLSESTVSRALNDYKDISQSTKKLVNETVVELGYQPNIFARRLASGNPECLGFVIPWRDGQLNNPFLGELMTVMSTALTKIGWDLTVLVAKSFENEVELFKKLSMSKNLSGLIISRTLRNDERFKMLTDLKIPFVAHGRSINCSNSSWLDVDNESAFFDMTKHFVSLGHRKIAHICGPNVYNFSIQRIEGWKKALLESGIQIKSEFLQVADLSFDGGKIAMDKLLKLKDLPTAVSCVSDTVAMGAMQSMRNHNLSPGKEISLMGYDGLELGAWIDPPLSTMTQPIQTVGKNLAEMLVNLVDGKKKPSDLQKLVRAKILRRGTDNSPMTIS